MNAPQSIKASSDSPFGKRPSFSYFSYDHWEITPHKILARQTVRCPSRYTDPTDPNDGQRCIEPHRLIRTPGDADKRYVPPPTGRYDTNATIRGRPLPFNPQTMDFSEEFIEELCTICADLPTQDVDGFSWEEAYHAHVSGQVPFGYMTAETVEAIDHHLRQIHGPQLAEAVGLDCAAARWISEQNMIRLRDNQLRSITGDELDPYFPMGYAFFASSGMVAHAVNNGEKPPMLIVQQTLDPSKRLLLVDAR
ncbi:hypothetical protein L218DRAFT_998656 [Marasmius fiardii PR-910]|nr:hypothetical protein L218DRAFT_998656 [Marasmius fiardii PR-910]